MFFSFIGSKGTNLLWELGAKLWTMSEGSVTRTLLIFWCLLFWFLQAPLGLVEGTATNWCGRVDKMILEERICHSDTSTKCFMWVSSSSTFSRFMWVWCASSQTRPFSFTDAMLFCVCVVKALAYSGTAQCGGGFRWAPGVVATSTTRRWETKTAMTRRCLLLLFLVEKDTSTLFVGSLMASHHSDL